MVHQYKLNGYNIVLDTASSSVHAVDEVAYDIIEMYKTHTPEQITTEICKKHGVSEAEVKECLDDIAELEATGQLFTHDEYESLAIDFKKRNTVVKALCLHIAHSCNLNCEYCFAAQGKYHGKDSLMSFETGKRALDFLIENSGTRRNLEVDFFGGEPLLNFEAVKQLVKYARSIEKEHNKNFRFTLTTNGVLIDDDVIDFCNAEMDNVVLSLDGRKEIHDFSRKDIGGAGSYDKILPKFKEFVKRRGEKSYYMRGTFTSRNPDFVNDILHMADLGFKELSMEPVVCKPTEEYALTDEHLPTLLEQYELLAKEMIARRGTDKEFTFYHYMLDLENGPCIYKRITGCGSGTEYMAVTPTGELYPCHQFVGDKDYLLGNIYDGVTNTQKVDEFKMCNAYAKDECKDCFARLYCSGGCAANSYHSTGSVNGVYEYGCKLFKKRIECAIMMKVAEGFENEHADS